VPMDYKPGTLQLGETFSVAGIYMIWRASYARPQGVVVF